MLGIVEHCAIAGLQPCAGGVRFCGAVVASVTGVGATGDLQPDPMPALERVSNRPEIKLDGMGCVRSRIGETDDPVGNVDRAAARRDVAQAGMQVEVRHRRFHVKADPHRTDHLQLGRLGIAGEGEDVWSGFEAAVVVGTC